MKVESRKWRVIVTCEHGGNAIPKPYRALFKKHGALLATHRGYDLGALGYARKMATRLDAPLFAASTSRLLVDLNRSPGHRRLFSEITRPLDAAIKKDILERHHTPHWARVEAAVQEAIATDCWVVHIGCHTFTPVLDGRVRSMDVGLLYDPRRAVERHFCGQWKAVLAAIDPTLRIRRNAPYKGVSDGLPTYLRTLFADNYLGLELELNQRDFMEAPARWRRLCAAVIESLGRTLVTRRF
jgi:predicted N-formylglutamate amidohydrolase